MPEDDPFSQLPPHVADDSSDPYRKPREPSPHKIRPTHELIALWWRTLFPICAFFGGLGILVVEAVFPSLRSNAMIGVGLVMAGLGPAGMIDVIRKIPD